MKSIILHTPGITRRSPLGMAPKFLLEISNPEPHKSYQTLGIIRLTSLSQSPYIFRFVYGSFGVSLLIFHHMLD